jgi:ubiquinone biosynthesis protein UbiJ
MGTDEPNDKPASLLKASLLATLEKTVNRTLASDPVALAALAEHSGRLLAFHLNLPVVDVFVLIMEDGVELYHASDAEPDVSVTASPADFAALFFNWQRQPELIGNRILIQGDRELLQQILAILRALDMDIGALLAPSLGDNLAQQLDYGSRRLFSWLKDTGQLLGQQLSSYLKQESGLLALRHDVYEFCRDVDELRFDVDRLAARIDRLRHQQGASS